MLTNCPSGNLCDLHHKQKRTETALVWCESAWQSNKPILLRRGLCLKLRLWTSQLTNTQILAKYCVIAFKGIKVFFLRRSSFPRPPLPHVSICPRPSHPSQWCQSGPAGASVWGTWWPGRRCRRSEVPPSPTSHSSSPRSLFFKLSFSFLFFVTLHCWDFWTFWPIQQFQSCFFLPGWYVALAKFTSLFFYCNVFSPTALCCPPFPKYLLVILHNREQWSNIRVLLGKCQMTAAKTSLKREGDMANKANAPQSLGNPEVAQKWRDFTFTLLRKKKHPSLRTKYIHLLCRSDAWQHPSLSERRMLCLPHIFPLSPDYLLIKACH